jgi:hypothetical protein
VSADGRYVAFYSYASNLVAGDTNERADVFVRDTQAGTTTRVSVDGTGAQADGDSFDPAVSADGRYVAFYSNASNLVAGDTNARTDAFVRDTLDAVAPAAPANLSTTPSSPSNSDDAPQVTGDAEAGSTVRVYTTADCSGPADATGTADGAGHFDIGASAASDSTRTFRATSTDAAGNSSDCSSSSVTYTHDSTPPGAFALVSPADGATVSDASPAFAWQAAAGAARYDLFVDGARVREGVTGTSASAPAPLAEGTHSWRVRAIDAAGNTTDSPTRSFNYTPETESSPTPAPSPATGSPAPSGGNQQPPAAPAPSLSRNGRARFAGRLVHTGFELACPAALPVPCSGSAKLYAKVRSRKSRALKRVRIGSAGFSIVSGTTEKITVKLNRRGRKLFAQRGGRLSALITYRRDGRRSATRRRMTLKP